MQIKSLLADRANYVMNRALAHGISTLCGVVWISILAAHDLWTGQQAEPILYLVYYLVGAILGLVAGLYIMHGHDDSKGLSDREINFAIRQGGNLTWRWFAPFMPVMATLAVAYWIKDGNWRWAVGA